MAAEHCDRKQQGSKRDEMETEYRIRLSVYTRRERDRAEDQKRRTEVMEQTERKGPVTMTSVSKNTPAAKCKSSSKWKMASGSPFQQHLNFD